MLIILLHNMLQNIANFVNKKLGTSTEYIFKGGLWLITNNLISATAAIMLAVVLGNILDPSVYGSYKYMMSVLVFVGAFSMNGLKAVIPQPIASGNLDFFKVG